MSREPDPAAGPARRAGLFDLSFSGWRLLGLGVGLSAGATLAGLLGGLWWGLDLLSHFAVHYLLFAALAGGVLLVGRRWRLSAAAGAVVLINLIRVVPIYLGGERPPAAEATLRVVSINVNTANRSHRAVIDYVRSRHPDIVLLMEVDQRWLEALAGLVRDYPYVIDRPRSDNFGIALLTRLEPRSLELRRLGTTLPTAVARLELAGRTILVVGSHPPPPTGGRMSRDRDRQLAEIGALLAGFGGPRILIGDLNTTPWSSSFSDLVDRSGLRDARRGFGVLASWPSPLGPLGIPLDHCLVSGDFTVESIAVGDRVGSDHLPLTIDLRFDGHGTSAGSVTGGGPRLATRTGPRPPG